MNRKTRGCQRPRISPPPPSSRFSSRRLSQLRVKVFDGSCLRSQQTGNGISPNLTEHPETPDTDAWTVGQDRGLISNRFECSSASQERSTQSARDARYHPLAQLDFPALRSRDLSTVLFLAYLKNGCFHRKRKPFKGADRSSCGMYILEPCRRRNGRAMGLWMWTGRMIKEGVRL